MILGLTLLLLLLLLSGVILLQLLTGLPANAVIATVEGALSRCKGDPASLANILDKRAGAWPLTGEGREGDGRAGKGRRGWKARRREEYEGCWWGLVGG